MSPTQISKRLWSHTLCASAALSLAACHPAERVAPIAMEQPHRPNIVVIVADDLGYSDLGSFGGEINTPNLDYLANQGVQLTNFYVSPACSPSRAMLLTGLDNHEAGFGTMLEVAVDDQRGAPGYEGYLPPDAPTLAEELKKFGYQTYMSGKWHLGSGERKGPSDRGFDRSFSLAQGAHNHFGKDLTSIHAANRAAPEYTLDGQPVGWPQDAYSSDVFTNYLLEFLNGHSREQPFFAYLAFTAPHWPLQAPREAIKKYEGVFDDGPDAIASARIVRMKASGLIANDFSTRILGDADRWHSLDANQRALEARRMEIYAAMVDVMDANIGRLISYLKARGELENTYILFLSDNGPENLFFDRAVNPANPSNPLPVSIDNSIENLGAADSYISYGPAWGQASAAPYWGTKEHTSEGGIRSAAIMMGPRIPAGSRERSVLHVRDLFPTILHLAQGSAEAKSQFGHRSNGSTIDFYPLLLDSNEGPVRRGEDVFWELFFRAAFREGDLKAVYQPTRLPVFGKQTAPGEVTWQLFDLSEDPGETNDLARSRPEDLDRLRHKWRKRAGELGVVLLPEDR